MNILFRTDSSFEIGTGHVMRCLTFAEKLTEKGAKCEFVCRNHKGNLIKEICKRNFFTYELPILTSKDSSKLNQTKETVHLSWLGSDWATDANETKSYVNYKFYDWIIVDHYAIDAKWEKELRKICRKIMVIDDLADRQHNCDLLLDQNLGRKKSHYKSLVPSNCQILTGPKYALLRPDFNLFREKSLARRKKPILKNLLITLGGIDADNITEKILKMLVNIPLPSEHQIFVIMGPNAPWIENIKSLSAKMAFNIKVKQDISNMAQIMANSDLAIGAAGSTSWERCSLGLPSIICAFADNQTFIANQLNLKGASKIFFIDNKMKNLHNILLGIMDNQNELLKMVKNASNVTDGLGTNRVTRELQKLKMV